MSEKANMSMPGLDRTYQSVHVFHAHLEASVSVVHQNSIIGSLRDSESHRFFGHGKQPIVDGRVMFRNGQGQRDEVLVEEKRKSEKNDPSNEQDCAASVVQTAVVAATATATTTTTGAGAGATFLFFLPTNDKQDDTKNKPTNSSVEHPLRDLSLGNNNVSDAIFRDRTHHKGFRVAEKLLGMFEGDYGFIESDMQLTAG